MATRFNDILIPIQEDETIRFISVYKCHKGSETKRHILNMVFDVVEPPKKVLSWKEILNFFVVNIIDAYILPIQSFNVSWESLKIMKGGTPHRHPLNLKGKINQDIGTLEKGLKIELQRQYTTQPSYTFIYGMPINLQELDKKKVLLGKLETLYLDPIGTADTLMVKYRGGTNRVSKHIMSCTIRGELGSRKKSQKLKRKKINFLVSNDQYS